ncbi:hypothetical protein DCAR_0206154 [Daucus carota subsp. sativus]|uniref:Uncharacterized protein n=1 Tax=Daucus carota subsp. sativus TaxID=79200 RepID=A0A166D1N0_DAUCS|nr:PREDICTED: UDP-glycosyltransferase 74E2-like [Daucus carota subsp. sativus]WOG86935.1 hypothetical protein DCAR_0206154 [Daucus carota subsp. sativus]
MGEIDRELACKTHVMIIPFPAQGHMSPMMQFSKRLAFKGVKVTMVVPLKLQDSMQILYDSPLISLECITFDFGKDEIPNDMQSYMGFMKLKITTVLPELLEKQENNGCPVKFLVIDSLFPSGVEMCHQFGLRGAPFFTQSCAVNAIYLNVLQGRLKIPFDKGLSNFSLPSLPVLDTVDMPSNVIGTFPDLWAYFSRQFSGLEKADWVFLNSFDKLETEEAKWLASHCPLTTVGPAIPSMYLDKKLPNDKKYGISLYKPEAEVCLNWLDERDPGTVVYISFGSVDKLSQEYMEEIGRGLLKSNSFFLWAIRDSEREKLSSDFISESSEKGLIVSWCPQLDVLAHRAVGSFMSHCGWNSTLEALSLGVPVVAVPVWFDQPTNGKYIVDIWRVGVRVPVDESGMVSREDVAACIMDAMEGDSKEEIRENALKWRQVAIEAMDEGGSSDRNIDDFISKLVSS